MIDLKFIGRSFDQICFVVPDLEKAMDYWRNTCPANDGSARGHCCIIGAAPDAALIVEK